MIAVSVQSGTPPYTYIWSNGDTTSSTSGLAGTYTVVVTDSAAETVSKSFTITQPSEFDVDARPYDTSQLADGANRNHYCLEQTAETSNILALTNARLNFATMTYSSSGRTAFSAVGSADSSGYGKLTFNCFQPSLDSTTNAPVLTLNGTGVTIAGDLTVTGNSTVVQVQDIVVQDKTITLADGLTDVDGAGMLLGAPSANVSLLYNAAAQALISTQSLFTNGELRVGSTWSDATTRLGSDSLSVTSSVGSVVLDASDFVLTGARLVDCNLGGAHTVNDDGLAFVSTGNYFGWNGSLWSTADALQAAKLQVSSTTSSLSSIGLDLATNSEAIYFAGRKWRQAYDEATDQIVFQKLNTTSGAYETVAEIAV